MSEDRSALTGQTFVCVLAKKLRSGAPIRAVKIENSWARSDLCISPEIVAGDPETFSQTTQIIISLEFLYRSVKSPHAKRDGPFRICSSDRLLNALGSSRGGSLFRAPAVSSLHLRDRLGRHRRSVRSTFTTAATIAESRIGGQLLTQSKSSRPLSARSTCTAGRPSHSQFGLSSIAKPVFSRVRYQVGFRYFFSWHLSSTSAARTLRCARRSDCRASRFLTRESCHQRTLHGQLLVGQPGVDQPIGFELCSMVVSCQTARLRREKGFCEADRHV
jgi:hypothetical protein